MSTDDHTPTYSLPYDPLTRELGVLVGFDGSEHSFEALDFAAQAATGMGTRLTVVTAYTVPAMVYPNMASMPPVPDDVARRAAAQEVLDEAAAHLKNHDGPLDLRAEEGDAAGVMVHLSAQARLAVVGARGRGGFLGRLLGSVSEALPAHAHCPTVVLPRTGAGDRDAAARVVLGVDSAAVDDVSAVAGALMAEHLGAPLHVVLVIPPLESLSAGYLVMVPDQATIDARQEDLEKDLATGAAQLQEHFPGLTVTSEVLMGDAVHRLSEQTETAQLTVLGTRGLGRWTGALLGSVSRAVLERAEGPVMVVPNLDPARTEHDPRRPR